MHQACMPPGPYTGRGTCEWAALEPPKGQACSFKCIEWVVRNHVVAGTLMLQDGRRMAAGWPQQGCRMDAGWRGVSERRAQHSSHRNDAKPHSRVRRARCQVHSRPAPKLHTCRGRQTRGGTNIDRDWRRLEHEAYAPSACLGLNFAGLQEAKKSRKQEARNIVFEMHKFIINGVLYRTHRPLPSSISTKPTGRCFTVLCGQPRSPAASLPNPPAVGFPYCAVTPVAQQHLCSRALSGLGRPVEGGAPDVVCRERGDGARSIGIGSAFGMRLC
eukprot:362965-Chlamydomonas_euryale.AAC.4